MRSALIIPALLAPFVTVGVNAAVGTWSPEVIRVTWGTAYDSTHQYESDPKLKAANIQADAFDAWYAMCGGGDMYWKSIHGKFAEAGCTPGRTREVFDNLKKAKPQWWTPDY